MRKGKFLSLVFLLGAMVGCGNESGIDSSFSAADTNFAEMMIPHHEQALEMSEIALTNSSNPELLELATSIRDAQAPEIEVMSSWPGVNPGLHSGHLMDGMLSSSEMNALKDATGVAFDRLFLEGMIKHHQGAIEMAEEVVDSENFEVAELANQIIASQKVEIERMQRMLANL